MKAIHKFLATPRNSPHRLDYHLCICKDKHGNTYYCIREYSKWDWVLEHEGEQVLAFSELKFTPEEILEFLKKDKH